MKKRSIKTYSLEELTQLMVDLGQPKFRADQLSEWLYVHHAASYEDMTNLPLQLRQQLQEAYPFSALRLVDKQISNDGTRKYVFSCEDDQRIETVAIPSLPSRGDDTSERLTICFSTQVGCSMKCSFCATGREGFTRNLSVGEMVDQILLTQKDMEQRVSNVVAMGQGEPFLNYDATLAALHIMNSQQHIRIGARHITVSTSGIIAGIERFSLEPEQFTLAVSLHAARQNVRNVLMPKVINQPLSDLKLALKQYLERTGRRITLEYLLIKEINDSKEDLTALVQFCDGLLCHINLLPMNEVSFSHFKPSPKATIQYWKDQLEQNHIETTLRKSRGTDISGACGQLKNSLSK